MYMQLNKKRTIEDAISEIVSDAETLESAVKNLPRDKWLLLVDLLGEITIHTDDPNWTPAMQEEMQHLGTTLGVVVRHAAALWALEPLGD